MSQLLQLLAIPGITKILPLITALIAAAKAKDIATIISLVVQILTILNPQPTPVPPAPNPTPGPQPVFAAAEPTEDEFVAHAVACGCDAGEAQALVDSLK